MTDTLSENRAAKMGCSSRLVRWLKRLDPNYRDQEDRRERMRQRIEAERQESVNPCPYCGAEVKRFRVTQRTRKGRMAGAEKEWACGTKTSLDMMHESGFERGDDCLSNVEVEHE